MCKKNKNQVCFFLKRPALFAFIILLFLSLAFLLFGLLTSFDVIRTSDTVKDILLSFGISLLTGALATSIFALFIQLNEDKIKTIRKDFLYTQIIGVFDSYTADINKFSGYQVKKNNLEEYIDELFDKSKNHLEQVEKKHISSIIQVGKMNLKIIKNSAQLMTSNYLKSLTHGNDEILVLNEVASICDMSDTLSSDDPYEYLNLFKSIKNSLIVLSKVDKAFKDDGKEIIDYLNGVSDLLPTRNI